MKFSSYNSNQLSIYDICESNLEIITSLILAKSLASSSVFREATMTPSALITFVPCLSNVPLISFDDFNIEWK